MHVHACAQADAGWETAVAVLKTVLTIAFDSVQAPSAMLRMKDFVLLVCSALGAWFAHPPDPPSLPAPALCPHAPASAGPHLHIGHVLLCNPLLPFITKCSSPAEPLWRAYT
jgi:hypothetical protein